MESYSLKKKMAHTFDFGYEVTVDMKLNIVNAYVYDKDDYDEYIMSFLACEVPSMNPVVYATGIVCSRCTCFGKEMIESFCEGMLGDFVVREMKDVFEHGFPNAELRLFCEKDFRAMCELAPNATWATYKHDTEALVEKLRGYFKEMIVNKQP